MKINHPMIFLVTKQKPKLFNIFIKKKKKHYSRLLALIVGQIRQEEALKKKQKQKQKQKNKQKKQKNQKQKKQKQKQRASNSGT